MPHQTLMISNLFQNLRSLSHKMLDFQKTSKMSTDTSWTQALFPLNNWDQLWQPFTRSWEEISWELMPMIFLSRFPESQANISTTDNSIVVLCSNSLKNTLFPKQISRLSPLNRSESNLSLWDQKTWCTKWLCNNKCSNNNSKEYTFPNNKMTWIQWKEAIRGVHLTSQEHKVSMDGTLSLLSQPKSIWAI